MSVSIISACKNRGKALSVAISSWIQFDEVDEIIVTDWNSDDPIDHLTKLDSRIKVISVPNELYFNQPQPLNLAASLTRNEYILKLDSDTIMNPYFNFFDYHKIDDKSFLTGTKRTKQSDIFKGLWGTLYITRENYLKIGGYNENMSKYVAWEDDEIYHRILILGLTHVGIEFESNTLFSLPHLFKQRIENFQAYTENPTLEQTIRERIKKYHDIEDDNIIYEALLEKHIKINYVKHKLTKESSYYVKPAIEWNIEQLSSQHYIAQKTLNK